MNEDNKNKPFKNVLVLGSGLVSEPLIYYLLNNPENKIKIGSNNLDEAQQLIINVYNHKNWKINSSNMKKRIEATHIDVSKEYELLLNLVKESNLVISLVPSLYHIHVMKACLEMGKSLITTSYITDDLKPFHKLAIEKNITFLFEMGISPGLDHIICNKVVREQAQLQNAIIGFESWVGAIPSPECIDNPLLYKFSWDPKGALLTLTYDAKQLINGKVITISEKNLLTNYIVDKKFHPSLNLEGYYNRNSIRYKELYNLKDANSVIMGNIRYQGFTFIIQCFKYLNLFSTDKINQTTVNWRDYLNKILKNPRIQDNIYEIKNKYIKKGFEMFVYNSELSDSLVERIFYYNLSLLALSYFDDRYIRKNGFELLFNRIYSVFIYLELYKEDTKVKKLN